MASAAAAVKAKLGYEIQLTEKELFEHAPTDEQQDEAEEDEQQAADEADVDVHMAVAESEDEA